MREYSTISGDTWDKIAFQVYGDCNYMNKLMEANKAHMETVIFSAGVMLTIPGIEIKAAEDTLPPWRK